MKTRRAVCAAGAFALLFATHSATAELHLYEPFDYEPLGDTLEAVGADGGTGWTGSYTAANDLTLVEGLAYPTQIPGVDASGNAVESTDNFNGRDYDASLINVAQGETVWFSFLVNIETYGNGQRLLFFNGGGDSGSSTRGVGVDFGPGGVFRGRMAGQNGPNAEATLELDQTYLVVGRVTWGDLAGAGDPHLLDLWLDPEDFSEVAALGEPTVSQTRAAPAQTDVSNGTISIGADSGIYLRSDPPTPITYDEIRLGDELEDVLDVPLAFTSAADVEVPDMSDGADFFTLTAFDPSGGNVTFAITGGADAAEFSLTADGVLSYVGNGGTFDRANPTDVEPDNLYELEVTATSDAGEMETAVQNLTVLVVSAEPPVVTASNITITGIASGLGGEYIIGDTVTVEWDNSEATGDGAEAGNGVLSSVTADLSQFGGSATLDMTDDGSGLYSATYTLLPGDVDVTDATVSVTATSAADATTTVAEGTFAVDNEAPLITVENFTIASTGSLEGGEFTNGDPVDAQWNNTETGDGNLDVGTVSFDFTDFEPTLDPPDPLIVDGVNNGDIWTGSYTIVGNTEDGTNTVDIVVVDDAGNQSVLGVDVEVLTAGVLIGDAVGEMQEGDPSVTATYDLTLSSPPTGPVTVMVTSDDQAEVSANGVDFGETAEFVLADLNPVTVTVRAVDDTEVEATHNATFAHSISASEDTINYPLNLIIEDATVPVLDDDTNFLLGSGGDRIQVEGGTASFPDVTIPEGENVVLVVVLGAEGGGPADGVTYAGETLTQATLVEEGPSRAAIYYLINPPVGTAPIDVAWSSNPFGGTGSLCYYVLSGVDQEIPVFDSSTVAFTGGATNASIDFFGLPDGSIIIDALVTNDDQAAFVTVGDGQILTCVEGDPGIGGGRTIASSIEGGLSFDQTQSMDWTEGGTAVRAVYAAVAFQPPQGGDGGDNFIFWTEINGLDGSEGFENGFTDNPEGDSTVNALEWILGGNPLFAESVSSLIQSSTNLAGDIILTFTRVDDSEVETELTLHYSTDLFETDSRTVVIPDAGTELDIGDGILVTIVENADDPDDITVLIPGTLSTGSGIYGFIDVSPL